MTRIKEKCQFDEFDAYTRVGYQDLKIPLCRTHYDEYLENYADLRNKCRIIFKGFLNDWWREKFGESYKLGMRKK